MCDCGCNTCETKKPALMLNESLAPRAILSEGLNHHLNANKPLTDHLYRAGSTAYFNLWAEARSYYSRGIIDITNEDDLAVLTETNLGHYGMFEGKKVPLDFPMLDEEEGVPHYTKDGKEWKGKLHKMPDGSLMSGNPHDEDGSGPNGKSEKLYHKEDLNEAKKAKKKNTKKLNKPIRDSSGGKAYKVYVKDPKTGNIKTIRFGSGGLRAKINDKKARNAFAARHKCSTKKDKTKAGYWSCRLPRYAKLLGLKSNFGGFW
jgi:hypothetical protein